MVMVAAEFTVTLYQSASGEVEMDAETFLLLPSGPFAVAAVSLDSVSDEMEVPPPPPPPPPPPVKALPSARVPGERCRLEIEVWRTIVPPAVASGLRFIETPSVPASAEL